MFFLVLRGRGGKSKRIDGGGVDLEYDCVHRVWVAEVGSVHSLLKEEKLAFKAYSSKLKR